MAADFDALLAESVKLELLVADLYCQFTNSFPEDADFWGKLMFEEVNHASIIRSVAEFYKPLGVLPHGLLAPVLQDVRDINDKLGALIEQWQGAGQSREAAFNIALELEQSAGELHFQKFMASQEASSAVAQVFKGLNRDDRDHAERIRLYMMISQAA